MTVAGGGESVGRPGAGEVVRRDDKGVTCRRWNRRRGPRTRLTEETAPGVFLPESRSPPPAPWTRARTCPASRPSAS